MNYMGTQTFQLGKTGWILGDIPNLIAGAMEMEIYLCPKCGKVEFFQESDIQNDNKIAKTTCPKCGGVHDIDYPKCPFCKFDYNSK